MELWWTSLDAANKVFWAIALATSVLLAIQLLLAMFGFDGDTDVDADVDGDFHDVGGGVFSIKAIVGFFTGFGWGGLGALEAGLGIFAAVAVALLCGGALMAVVVLLMRVLYSMRDEGTLDYRNAVGEAGSAYIPIPAAMSGPGQVEVRVQGRLCVVSAFTRHPERIPTRARVKVVGVLDQQTILVEPLGAETGEPQQAPQEG